VSSGNPSSTHWRGVLKGALAGADLHVGVEADPAASAPCIYTGSITTDASQCFTSGALTAIDSNGSWTMDASGSGSATQDCIIEITGQSTGNQISGLFSMTSALPTDCNVDATPFTLVRE
jgi:hypothetical protein